MKFRTELKFDKQRHDVTHSDSILAIGSCFVENIGIKLSSLKFNINVNPFGIIFNPYSMAKILNNGLKSPIKLEKECDVLEYNGVFKSYDFHSKFNAATYNNFINKVDIEQKGIRTQLENTNYLFLTFGTAWVYRLIEAKKIVANCQKIPQSNFTKELLDLNDITTVYVELIKKLIKSNPSIKIVLTVSPVRHTKDGIVENNQSKSVLLLLCKALSDDFKQNVIYFPSYEIQMDDLRDYRFYNADLVHPNQIAIDYIFEQFSKLFFTENTTKLNEKIEKLSRLQNHVFLSATDADIKKHNTKIDMLKLEIGLP
jgi:hypothetical protein